MDFTDILRFALIVVAVVLVGLFARWARSRPNRSKDFPDRIRMPKLVPIIGWIFIAVGALMSLVAFIRPPEEGALPMQIASVAILGCGLLFLVMYRNWYIAPGADEVAFRTIFGTEKTIRYDDIVEYEVKQINGQPMLLIAASMGAKLRVNLATYDVAPMLAHIEFHQKHGRWPLRGN